MQRSYINEIALHEALIDGIEEMLDIPGDSSNVQLDC
jgi:hypothetical protein